MGKNLRIFISEGNNRGSSDAGLFCPLHRCMGKPLGWREGVLPCLVLCFGSCRQDLCPVKDVQLSQDPGNWQEFWGAGLLGNSFLPMWGGHEASHSPHPEVSSLVKAAHLKNR